MDSYCDVCDKFVKPKSRYKHFKSNILKEFDKCTHMELTIENLDIHNVDEVFYAYILQLNKQYDHYLIKCHFKLVFNDNQYSTWNKSHLFINKTMNSWRKYLQNVIDDFKYKGYTFNHIEEMNIITISNEVDMS